MEQYLTDPWRASVLAGAVVERTAQELREILSMLATTLDPFPGFEGLQTLQAVEIDLGNFTNPDLGCVVVGPDGLLYELVLRAIPGPIGVGGIDQLDELTELDLEPSMYVLYAHHAIIQLGEIHQQRRSSP